MANTIDPRGTGESAVRALDVWDLAVLALALSFLDRHAATEAASAKSQRNVRRQAAMMAMREHIATLRAKLLAMQGAP